MVPEPEDLRSQDGVLTVALTIRNYKEKDGSIRYCYLLANGTQSPTLRLNPGDLLVLNLKNDLTEPESAVTRSNGSHVHAMSQAQGDPCTSGAMLPTSTNLHFHGLTLPPVCHQDDVWKTSIQPGDPPFEYRFRIPANESPGLYWYHPHIHGFSKAQVLGGASGALIIQGIERAIPMLRPQNPSPLCPECSSTATVILQTTAQDSGGPQRISRSTSFQCHTRTIRPQPSR